MKKKACQRVLQEVYEFGRRERNDLPFTRKALARLFECQEQEVARVLEKKYKDGYKREVESLFDGGTLRYVSQRFALVLFGLST